MKEKLQEDVPIEMEEQEKHFLNPEAEDSGERRCEWEKDRPPDLGASEGRTENEA